jgi:hypothetical protein
VSRLSDVAAELLAKAEQALIAAGRPGFDRIVVSHGPPPHVGAPCCETLAVHWEPFTASSVGAAFPNAAPTIRCTGISNVPFVVTIIRCWPLPDAQGNQPDPDTITTAAGGLSGDVWAVWCAFLSEAAAGSLLDGVECTVSGAGPGGFLEPRGSCAAVTLRVTAQLDCTEGGS